MAGPNGRTKTFFVDVCPFFRSFKTAKLVPKYNKSTDPLDTIANVLNDPLSANPHAKTE